MRPGWLFFALFGYLAVPGRFVSLFYEAHAQTPSQIGLLCALPAVATLISNPYFCHLGDRLKSRLRVLLSVHFFAVFTFVLQILAFPKLNVIPASCRFPFLLTTAIVFGSLNAPIYPLISGITIDWLKKRHGPEGHILFGAERLWGAISWAINALILGKLLDIPSLDVRTFYVVFVVAAAFLAGTAACFSFFAEDNTARSEGKQFDDEGPGSQLESQPFQGQLEDREKQQCTPEESAGEQSPGLRDALAAIIWDGKLETIMYFNLLFWVNVGMSLVETLLFLFFAHNLNASNFMCGVSVLVTVVFEIPIFAKADSMLLFMTATRMTLLGAFCYVIRVVGYILAPSVWWVLLVEPFHGVTYAFVHTASVQYVADKTPKRLEATGQSIIEFLRMFGIVVGSASGGFVMERYGAKVMYGIAGTAVVLAMAAFIVSQYLQKNVEESEYVKGTHDIEEFASPTTSSGSSEGIRLVTETATQVPL